jgi:DHA1 family multidrug resistance protein-like MFS transporter
MTPKLIRRFPLNRELVLLFIINTIMSLGMNLTNSLRPLYIQSLGATVLEVSFVISITGLAGTIMRLPSGFISDIYGRRKIIILSILLAISPPLLYTFSSNWEQLIIWGIVYSIAFALFMPSRMAIVADYTSTANRMRVYSIMNLAFPLGSIIGPTIGGFLENTHGWNMIFYVATALYLFCLVPSLVLSKPPRNTFENDKKSSSKRAKIDLKFLRPLLSFFFLNLFTGLGMGTVSPITPIYLMDKFNVSTAEIGLFISVGFGVTTILTQIPAGILADKIGRKKFIAICLMVQMGINALWSMTWPASISLLMEHSPRNRRGLSSGLTQTGIMFGFAIGPYIGGYLWETVGMAFPYYASALFLILCIPTISFIKEKSVKL